MTTLSLAGQPGRDPNWWSAMDRALDRMLCIEHHSTRIKATENALELLDRGAIWLVRNPSAQRSMALARLAIISAGAEDSQLGLRCQLTIAARHLGTLH